MQGYELFKDFEPLAVFLFTVNLKVGGGGGVKAIPILYI